MNFQGKDCAMWVCATLKWEDGQLLSQATATSMKEAMNPEKVGKVPGNAQCTMVPFYAGCTSAVSTALQ